MQSKIIQEREIKQVATKNEEAKSYDSLRNCENSGLKSRTNTHNQGIRSVEIQKTGQIT